MNDFLKKLSDRFSELGWLWTVTRQHIIQFYCLDFNLFSLLCTKNMKTLPTVILRWTKQVKSFPCSFEVETKTNSPECLETQIVRKENIHFHEKSRALNVFVFAFMWVRNEAMNITNVPIRNCAKDKRQRPDSKSFYSFAQKTL